ncbi:hypothetical protein A33O_04443 [Nitratireductor aquibiodomus RA22]|uniref:Uncharacterized protein n=1 Tax=Nitratireductor aquibiodomus RA22 TaxID=1189611 RepID=I5C4S8_9HYPH|nr:hypothetical protein [Nitratireductor aquibiodomus]EIM76830.1 hypothetical protein A33O_04443 [Nitratireductor aquibiodomus RA22]
MKGASGAHGCGIGAVRAWSEARDFRARRSRRAQTASAFHGIDEAVKLLAFTQFKTESRFPLFLETRSAGRLRSC